MLCDGTRGSLWGHGQRLEVRMRLEAGMEAKGWKRWIEANFLRKRRKGVAVVEVENDHFVFYYFHLINLC